MKLLIVFGLLPLLQAYQRFDTRQTTSTLISTLEALAYDNRATAAFDKMFNNDNSCLNNLGEAIEVIKQSADLFAAVEGDLEALNTVVEGMMGQEGEVEALKGTAAIFRALQPLVEKLGPSVNSMKDCSTSLDSLRGLSVVMHELSYDDTVAVNAIARDMFHRSGNIVSIVATFLSQLQSQARNFGSLCNPDKTSIMRAVSAIGDMVGSLADLFSSVGNYKAGVEIRKGADFAQNIAVSSVKCLKVENHPF